MKSVSTCRAFSSTQSNFGFDGIVYDVCHAFDDNVSIKINDGTTYSHLPNYQLLRDGCSISYALCGQEICSMPIENLSMIVPPNGFFFACQTKTIPLESVWFTVEKSKEWISFQHFFKWVLSNIFYGEFSTRKHLFFFMHTVESWIQIDQSLKIDVWHIRPFDRVAVSIKKQYETIESKEEEKRNPMFRKLLLETIKNAIKFTI